MASMLQQEHALACFMMAYTCLSFFSTHTQQHTAHFLFESVRYLYPLPIHHVCIWVCVCPPDKVDDPVMAVQIAWMMEVPELYRRCYDKPLQLQPIATGYKHPSLNSTAQSRISFQFSAHLNRIYRKSAKENAIERFSIHRCHVNISG